MNYLRIALDGNSKNRKFILFYADYLQEAWLSEVFEDDTTKILKQFRCKTFGDIDKVADYISKSGRIVNLRTESTENSILILKNRLGQPKPDRKPLFPHTWLYQFLTGFTVPILGNL